MTPVNYREPIEFRREEMTHLKDRIIRAAKLDLHLYEEVEADKGALGRPCWLSFFQV